MIGNGNVDSNSSNSTNANNSNNNSSNSGGNIRKRDFQKRKPGEQEQFSSKENNRSKHPNKSNTHGSSVNSSRDSGFQKSSHAGKENASRHNYNNNHSSRGNGRVKTEETIEDIRTDIARIEKEIELELKEIRSLRLGV